MKVGRNSTRVEDESRLLVTSKALKARLLLVAAVGWKAALRELLREDSAHGSHRRACWRCSWDQPSRGQIPTINERAAQQSFRACAQTPEASHLCFSSASSSSMAFVTTILEGFVVCWSRYRCCSTPVTSQAQMPMELLSVPRGVQAAP